jgi:hypothetical protein
LVTIQDMAMDERASPSVAKHPARPLFRTYGAAPAAVTNPYD